VKRTLDIEIKVGLFVGVGLLLASLALIMSGGEKSFFEGSNRYKVIYSQVDGLQAGSTVKIAGFRVGSVEDLHFKDDGSIEVVITVLKKYTRFVRKDSLAQIGTQGVLGDKYVNITVGNQNLPLLENGSIITPENAKEFKDYLTKGDQLIENLNKGVAHMESILSSFNREGRAEKFFKNLSATAESMSSATKDLPIVSKEMQISANHIKSIMSKIDRGEGTMGAIINDPSLYDDLKSLLGGANRNRILKYFIKKSVEDSRAASQESVRQAASETK
jgi:phospholipid/cholesterol/gamma-HCH transport system substrate-binding protein